MLSASADAHAADWLVAGVRDFDHAVGSVVPAVFEAYARVFHPASRDVGAETVAVRWADVASANSRVMHPAAEWGSITGPWKHRHGSGQPGVWDEPPSTGELPHVTARRLAELLVEHTNRREHCFFALCEGGVLGLIVLFPDGMSESERRRVETSERAGVETWEALIGHGASFKLSGREMRLLNGPLAAIEDFYEHFRGRPSLWWPSDRAWCVGTDIDLMTTYVGGSRACVGALLDDQKLEALAVSVDQRLTWDADTINPLPKPP
jgi:hypothetical protein